jgi:hypothetical protein
MTMATEEPVVSGQAYTVAQVDGRPPTGLGSCIGERVLTLVMKGVSHRVFGAGMEPSGRVRFHQKDLGPARTARTSGCGRSAIPVTTHCSPSIAPHPNPGPSGAPPRSPSPDPTIDPSAQPCSNPRPALDRVDLRHERCAGHDGVRAVVFQHRHAGAVGARDRPHRDRRDPHQQVLQVQPAGRQPGQRRQTRLQDVLVLGPMRPRAGTITGNPGDLAGWRYLSSISPPRDTGTDTRTYPATRPATVQTSRPATRPNRYRPPQPRGQHAANAPTHQRVFRDQPRPSRSPANSAVARRFTSSARCSTSASTSVMPVSWSSRRRRTAASQSARLYAPLLGTSTLGSRARPLPAPRRRRRAGRGARRGPPR